jgi:hypothetical protein
MSLFLCYLCSVEGKMNIRDEAETGWPSRGNLVQRVAAYTRNGRVQQYGPIDQVIAAVRRRDLYRWRIGITNAPDARAAKYGSRYDEMILIYRTTSIQNVRQWEDRLLEVFKDKSDNLYIGGGRSAGEGPYYVYLVRKQS